MNHALVTGGAGFIGSHLVSRLLDADWTVSVLDDFSTGRLDNLPVHTALDVFRGSVADSALCRSACRGVDTVFHLAGTASVAASLADPLATHATNLTGTINILDAARREAVRRVILSSSASVYGDCARKPIEEDERTAPQSPYACQKAAGELYCRTFWSLFGVETVILRYFNVFGPRQNPSTGYAAAIPLFIDAALNDRPITIYGDGEQTRDFVYVDDVVSANIVAAASPDAVGETFNIASGREVTVNEVVDTIDQILGARTHRVHGPARPGEVRESLASVRRAECLLGYRPTVDLETGIGQSIASALRSNRTFTAIYAERISA